MAKAAMTRMSEETFAAMNETAQRFQLYTTLCDVSDQITSIENEASDMMSPEKIEGMMGAFLGGGMGG